MRIEPNVNLSKSMFASVKDGISHFVESSSRSAAALPPASEAVIETTAEEISTGSEESGPKH
jgi:hypothetical protein